MILVIFVVAFSLGKYNLTKNITILKRLEKTILEKNELAKEQKLEEEPKIMNSESRTPIESSEISDVHEELVQKRLLITLNNQTFDLSTEYGKMKWREAVQLQISKRKEKTEINIQAPKPSYAKLSVDENVPKLLNSQVPSEIKFSILSSDASRYINRDSSTIPKRARDDINIHDPAKPVPSVLNHPVVDEKGRPLRRIFIPGRGWVSSKTLAQEKKELIMSVQQEEDLGS